MSQPVSIVVKSKGKDISRNIQIISIETCYECNEIPVASLKLADGDPAKQTFKQSENKALEAGNAIEIHAGSEKGKEKPVFIGLITGQQINISKRGELCLNIICHGDVIKLVDLPVTSVFDKKTKDADAIKKLLSNAGVKVAKVENSTISHTQLTQFRQSSWEFIKSRVFANGFLIMSGIKGVNIIDPKFYKGKEHEIKMGMSDVLECQLNLDISSQPKSVKTSAWDIKNQKNSKETEGKAPKFNSGSMTPAKAAKALSHTKPWQLHKASSINDAEVSGWSNAEASYRFLDLYHGKISLSGRNDIQPGDMLKLVGFGSFTGKHFISGIRHCISTDGWQTIVKTGLPLTRSLLDKHRHEMPSINGILIGQVAAFEDDPEGFLRIPVIVHAFGKNKNKLWARLATPYATKEEGFFFPPKINDEVILGFTEDDPRHPVILGVLHNPKNKPPFPYQKEIDKRGVVMKETELSILFNEKEKQIDVAHGKKGLISCKNGKGLHITHDKDKVIVHEGLAIDSSKDVATKAKGAVKIKASGKMEIKASKTEVS